MTELVPASTINALILGVKEWQTLVAGIFAIAAAFFTVKAMKSQTKAHETLETSRREGILRSKKSIFSVTLNGFYKGCLKSAKEIDRQSFNFKNFHNLTKLQKFLVNKKSFNLISSIIEHEQNQSINELMSHLIYKVSEFDLLIYKFNDYVEKNKHDEASFELDDIAECLGSIAAISVKLLPYSYAKEVINTEYPNKLQICALFTDNDLVNIELEEHLIALEKMTQHLLAKQ